MNSRQMQNLLISSPDTDSAGPHVPLSVLKNNEKGRIVRISGKGEAKRFLTELGFLPGTIVTAVNSIKGNVIVDVRGSKVALDSKVASRIIVSQ